MLVAEPASSVDVILRRLLFSFLLFFFFQAEDGIRDGTVTGVQTCALPIYLGTTGFQPWNWESSRPRTGLCDSTSAFPATHASVTHLWINYTGCDSLYAARSEERRVGKECRCRWSP